MVRKKVRISHKASFHLQSPDHDVKSNKMPDFYYIICVCNFRRRLSKIQSTTKMHFFACLIQISK